MNNEKCINENSKVNKDLVDQTKEDLMTKFDPNRAYKNYLIKTLREAEGNIFNKININEFRIIKVACEELLREFNIT